MEERQEVDHQYTILVVINDGEASCCGEKATKYYRL